MGDLGQQREDTDAASASGGGWDAAEDLADQLSNHGINGASRAASIDSRATSYQEAKAWQSDDDWGDDDPPPQPRARPVQATEGQHLGLKCPFCVEPAHPRRQFALPTCSSEGM